MSTSPWELIITQATWRTAMQDALRKQHRWITARLLRSEEREPPAFYANSLVSHTEMPSGALYPPLADWLVIHLSQEPIAEEANWLWSLQPRFAQVLVALVVGLGKEQQSWQGWIVEREHISQLESCHLVGPGMIHLQAKATPPRPVPARWERLAHALGPRFGRKCARAELA